MLTEKNILDDERTIALFDILGFRQRIKTSPKEEIKSLILLIEMLSNDSLTNPDSVGSMIYSDSIILYGKYPSDADRLNMEMLIISASNLLGLAANNGIPMRGALCKGHIYINENEKQIMGEALVHAYEIEQKQDWMGAIISPDQEKYFQENIDKSHRNAHCRDCILKYPAPFKTGHIKNYLCIDWMFRTNGEKMKNCFFETHPTYEVNQKMKNTLEYYDYAKNVDKNKYRAYEKI